MNAARRYPDGSELRSSVAELRAGAGRRLHGYAATFGTPAAIGGFTETIRAGAFRSSLAAKGDILALVDHDPGRLLARTGSGTLRLAEDAHGLSFELDLPDTTLGRDMLALAERRDLGGMSFGFLVKDESWPTRDRRELRAVDLIEISVVQAHPAYAATTISARAMARAAGYHAAVDRIRRMRLLELA